MRTDLWTLMRGGSGGGGGGGGQAQPEGARADSGRTKHRTRRPPPPPPPDPAGSASADFSDAPSPASSVGRESLHLRTDSIAFTPSRPSGPLGRPRGPPPPPPSSSVAPTDPHLPTADRRSQPSIALPRRSILAPEAKREDDDDDGDDRDDDRDEHEPKRTRSRILSELRPVASPREAAEISTPIRAPPPSPPRVWLPDEDEARDEDADAAETGDYQSWDALGSPTSARRRAFDIFASRRVRLQRRWGADLWVFMKNAHPALAPIAAHRWHPFRRLDRVLVLLVALAAVLVVSGIVATRPCCSAKATPTPTTATPTASLPALPLATSNATTDTNAAVSCACGLAHTSGLVAVAIAAVVPLVILLLEPLVTLYHDAKLFGCAVRVRRGRASGVCCAYRPDGLAARVGRAFVLLLLVALAFAAGVVAARAWDEDAAVDLDAVLVEWAAVFAAAAALGLVGYCSVVWLALFAVRWWREGRDAKAAHNASELLHQWSGPVANHETSPV